MSVFWQVFWGFIAAWAVTRLFANWLLGKLLRTAKKADAIKIEGAERIAQTTADEVMRRLADERKTTERAA